MGIITTADQEVAAILVILNQIIVCKIRGSGSCPHETKIFQGFVSIPVAKN